MILADKIIALRKSNGWSQEELAEKLNVSRQSVSKWESAQSMPDLDRVLQMSELFGVTTDYLLKDEIEVEKSPDVFTDSSLLHVSMEEANEYLNLQEEAARKVSLGVFLCIFSPICLLCLQALADAHLTGISEEMAVGIGIVVILLLAAAAVALFVHVGMHNEPWEFLEQKEFETAYGVEGMVRERQKAFRSTYVRMNVIGICLCVISPIPVILSSIANRGTLMLFSVALLLAIVSAGVLLIVRVGVQHESMAKLLQEGDYTVAEKKNSHIKEIIAGVYWSIVTAIYLGWSLIDNAWGYSWIIWPIAGVLFGAVMVVAGAVMTRRE